MDLSRLIREAVSNRKKDAPRSYIGCSTIGKSCKRAIWYALHETPKDSISPELEIIFDTGKTLEGLILDYIELAGIQVTRPSASNHNLYCFDDTNAKFMGHLDGIIYINNSPCVLEIKTMKDARFQSFKKRGLIEAHPEIHSQLQAYIGMKNYKSGVLLAMNKDTQELHHEWVEFDPHCYAELQAKAAMIKDSIEPPIRISNSPLSHICNRCEYKRTCFSEE